MTETLYSEKNKKGKSAQDAKATPSPAGQEPRAQQQDELGNDLDDADMDKSDESDDDEAQRSVRKAKDIGGKDLAFVLEGQINFSSHVLRDLLSEKGLVGDPSMYEVKEPEPDLEEDIWADATIDLDDDNLWEMH